MKASGKYQAAWKLQPSSHAALYNWGVALSDLARVVKAAHKDSAHGYLQQAGDKYQMSLKLHPHNPQACPSCEIETADVSRPALIHIQSRKIMSMSSYQCVCPLTLD